MNIEDIKIADRVWLMVNNKPVQLIVSKIATTQELQQLEDLPVTNTTIMASYSNQNNHDHTINIKETFTTADDLQRWLFNFENKEK